MTASQPDDITGLPTYLTILRGLERLLLVDILTGDDAETIMKLCVDRYDTGSDRSVDGRSHYIWTVLPNFSIEHNFPIFIDEKLHSIYRN